MNSGDDMSEISVQDVSTVAFLRRQSSTPQAPIEDWDVWAVRNWLKCNNFESFADLFQQADLGGLELLALNRASFEELGQDVGKFTCTVLSNVATASK